jgi:hypothetical protein
VQSGALDCLTGPSLPRSGAKDGEVLGALEAVTGESERGIEHLHPALRLSPRQSRKHGTHQVLATACYIAKKYEEGVAWALRAIHDMPSFVFTHINLVTCLVGMGEIDKAKTAFVVSQKLAPAIFKSMMEVGGTSGFGL